ncbi:MULTISPECIES: SGNH/GDSL hydrolase family protein [Streptosporangium]|uniref:Lysophospholipase L1-like esterase n=1 Tax=Streptosporangium brasiliense TaxID=47480 RepID=A0ABT9R5L7_9ACTN|nr:GDSL-type esterase/lipase family protein [Streptosporangium brasiliense]MDP9864539.1 lysophospholipase L1-like esterase [Streptosporangium brasiliense]
MNTALTERLIRFQHPQKVLGYLGRLDDDRVAALFGLDVGSYRQMRQAHDEQARRAALDLLAEPGFAEKVDRLPFQPGRRVVAVGESTTGDLLSWFEILRHLVELRRPADDISLVNMAVTGQTTTQALAALPGLSFQRPDWVLCMLGANDVQRLGSADGPTLVSLTETERNLRALRDLAARRTTARWVWLTPPGVDEERVAAYQPFQQAGITWTNRDIDAVGKILNALPDSTVDIRSVIAGQTAEPSHLDDGVHLSLAGQRALAAALVDALAGVS